MSSDIAGDNVNVNANAFESFDIESFISNNYDTNSNITLQRLLFLSRTVPNKDVSRRGYQMLEKQLKSKGEIQLYRQVFGMRKSGDGDGNRDTKNETGGEDGMMEIDNDIVEVGGGDPEVVSMINEAASRYVNRPPHMNMDTNTNPPPSDITFDDQYIQSTEHKFMTNLQILEANLSTSQAHVSTSSIRASYLELAKFYQSRGKSSEAVRFYHRAKEHCSTSSIAGAGTSTSGNSGTTGSASGFGSGSGTSSHSQNQHYSNEIILSLAECGLETQKALNDQMVINLCQHAINNCSNSNNINNSNNNKNNNSSRVNANVNTNNDHHYSSKLKCLRGIAHLNMGEYHAAATSFLSITDVNFTNQFNSVLSAEDLALYGGLLGLITLDRAAIETKIDVEVWRGRIDSIPQLREAIRAYMKADYGRCLKLMMMVNAGDDVGAGNDDGSGKVEKGGGQEMATIKDRMVHDMFLYPHIDVLWKMMREKCIVQYYRPYSSVSLVIMAESFGFDSVDEVEDIVASLIESRRIVGAKIDGVRRTLTSLSVGGLERRKRRMMVKKAGMMGDKLINEVEGMILRVACVENEIVVVDETKANNRRRGTSGGGRGAVPHIPFDCVAYSSDEECYDMM